MPKLYQIQIGKHFFHSENLLPLNMSRSLIVPDQKTELEVLGWPKSSATLTKELIFASVAELFGQPSSHQFF